MDERMGSVIMTASLMVRMRGRLTASVILMEYLMVLSMEGLMVLSMEGSMSTDESMVPATMMEHLMARSKKWDEEL
jgi:hypothetical protein